MGNGESAASFDLLPADQPFAEEGVPRGSLATAYNVAPGKAVTLRHDFTEGQVFKLGAEGNWLSADNTANSFRIRARIVQDTRFAAATPRRNEATPADTIAVPAYDVEATTPLRSTKAELERVPDLKVVQDTLDAAQVARLDWDAPGVFHGARFESDAWASVGDTVTVLTGTREASGEVFEVRWEEGGEDGCGVEMPTIHYALDGFSIEDVRGPGMGFVVGLPGHHSGYRVEVPASDCRRAHALRARRRGSHPGGDHRRRPVSEQDPGPTREPSLEPKSLR